MKQVKNFHILIEGRVQGVGYRRFAHSKAFARQLKGSVRNLLDGRVEVKVSGDEQSLTEFVAELKGGPAFASVRDVKVRSIEEVQVVDFHIGQDEELK